MGRHHEALESFERALASSRIMREAFNNRGNVFVELNRPAEALADYERALALKPDFTDALVNRGNALALSQGPIGEALASFDARSRSPEARRSALEQGLLWLEPAISPGWRGI